MTDRASLEQAIVALEAQRAILGDAVVDVTLASLREKLAGLQTPADEQRKLVTVLFADISGFTALSETFDAEDITRIMNRLWQHLDAVVLRYGGRIDKHIGDALMALWGADTAREDAPEQAVRAALHLQTELAAFREQHGLKLSMRIGLNTGPVLLGSVGTTREYTAMGDTVNLASRLEHAAPVGGVLIAHDTYRHIRGLCDAIPQEPLSVKGKREPILTYVVTRMHARSFHTTTRGVEGVRTRTIGRESELLALQSSYRDAVEGQETRMVVVVGEAGVGKSRLLLEMERWVGQQPEPVNILLARATLETQYQSGGVLRDLLATRCGITDTDDLDALREKLMAGLAPLEPQAAAVLGQAAGFDFTDVPTVRAALGSDFTNMATAYLATYLRLLTDACPAVLLFEDLHWADDRSLDLLDASLERLPDRQLLALGMARPVLYERRPNWGAGQAHNMRLDLRPLSARAGRELVREILQRVADIPEVLRDLIVTHAEGNPFYIEELVKMFIEERVIVYGPDDTSWSIHTDRLVNVSVPATLTGVLQARLDSLSLDEKTTLQRASVVGRSFWDVAIAALADEPISLHVGILDGLRSRELVFRRERSAFADTQEYVFKHALLRDVTYESVLKRQRRVYHYQAAIWLEQASGSRADEYAAVIADHYALAEEPALEGIWQARAGQQAAAQHAHNEALRRLDRALQQLPTDDHTTRYNVLLARERVHYIRGEREAQSSDLRALEVQARALGDSQRQAEVALRWSTWHQAIGNFTEAIESARQATELVAAESQLMAEARLYWGRGLVWLGDGPAAQRQLEAALELARDTYPGIEMLILEQMAGMREYAAVAPAYFEQALSIARKLGALQTEAWITHYHAGFAYEKGHFLDAFAAHRQAQAIFHAIGDRGGEAWALGGLGEDAHLCGELASAWSYLEQALAIFRANSDRLGEAYMLIDLGVLATHQGDGSSGLAYLEQSLKLCRELRDQESEVRVIIEIGRTLSTLGLYQRAIASFQAAISLCNDAGDRNTKALGQAELACMLRMQSDLPDALTQIEHVLQWLETDSLNRASVPAREYLCCIEVLYDLGDPRADTLLERAYTQIMAFAMALSKEDRKIFLEGIAWNRAIIDVWEQRKQ